MLVAMLHWAFPPVIGGVETHLVLLGPQLVKRGWDVSLLTGAPDGVSSQQEWDEMRVFRTPLMDLNSLSPESMRERRDEIRREIMSFLDRCEPDLIHAHNMHYFSYEHTRILVELKEKMGIPLLLTAHNVWDDELWGEMLSFADQWDGVIAVSHYIKKELVASGYPAERVDVVHHGIDLRRFRPWEAEEKEEIYKKFPVLKGRRVIFHPARLSYDKGSHLAVRALREVKKAFPDVLLVLAGTEKTVDWDRIRDQQVKEIMGMIEDFDLKENVWIQFFSWDEMPQIYQAADVCIYPSCFEEPFGIAVIESMASGRPIIASRAGGMPEIIQDGVSGLLITKGSYRELEERLVALLEDPELVQKLVKNGLKRVESEFSLEKMVERTEAVYRRLVADRSHVVQATK